MFSPQQLAGKQVGDFRLEEYVASGAMGMVFKARDLTLDRTVAIKLIPRRAGGDPEIDESRKRLIKEARAAGTLTHPNIVMIHSYGETDEFEFISMEFVKGDTLADLLNKKHVLQVNEALHIFEQILSALDVVNAQGIVHRDIKPTNIMINDQGLVKLMDFGIATLPSLSMTTPGTVLGTPLYMSPEQIAGRQVDTRSDIFSLGTVFYQSLTGATPFQGKDISDIALEILHGEPEPPDEINGQIPQFLSSIILKALAKDPADRYQNPQQMLADLTDLRTSVSHTGAAGDATVYHPVGKVSDRTGAGHWGGKSSPRLERRSQRLEHLWAVKDSGEVRRSKAPLPARKKKLKVSLAILSVVLVLAAGSFAAFKLFRQPSPELGPPGAAGMTKTPEPAAQDSQSRPNPPSRPEPPDLRRTYSEDNLKPPASSPAPSSLPGAAVSPHSPGAATLNPPAGHPASDKQPDRLAMIPQIPRHPPVASHADSMTDKGRALFELARNENPKLIWDSCLAEKAYKRAEHMVHEGYFDHIDPKTGRKPFVEMTRECVPVSKKKSKITEGENLSKGVDTPANIHKTLMASSTHRENITNTRFNRLGVGCYDTICVELFLGY
ncbi:MAG TPA: protein kinase [Syntrophobacteraceae bacterium]|nr:protein kinase [Syntrophobacteraceae bacterium]